MSFPRQLGFLALGFCLSVVVWADPPPEFTADGVIGRGDVTPRLLAPGAGLSIYGHYLGATRSGCVAPKPPYPHEICGTQVFIGDQPAELLFVSEKQINFKVPVDVKEGVHADLRVVRDRESSAPVPMEVGYRKTMVYLDEPAYTDMPVWLRVDLPYENGVLQYPFGIGRAGFGCNVVEVRKDGKPLPILPGSEWDRHVGVIAGAICGPLAASSRPPRAGRLPLHLLYRFDVPGTYEVRFTFRRMPLESQDVSSEWTAIEVLPAKAGQREAWLKSLQEHGAFDAGELVSDVLPGILGIPDRLSFEILRGYLDHPDPAVRRYAANGLYYWPDEFVADSLPGFKR